MAGNQGKNPNSIAALKAHAAPQFTSETSNAAREKGLETRRRQKAEREALKEFTKGYKDYSEVANDAPLAVEVLRLSMMQALKEGDYDKAEDLATKLAPYETAKKASVESTVVEMSYDELTKEELMKKAQDYLKVVGKK